MKSAEIRTSGFRTSTVFVLAPGLKIVCYCHKWLIMFAGCWFIQDWWYSPNVHYLYCLRWSAWFKNNLGSEHLYCLCLHNTAIGLGFPRLGMWRVWLSQDWFIKIGPKLNWIGDLEQLFSTPKTSTGSRTWKDITGMQKQALSRRCLYNWSNLCVKNTTMIVGTWKGRGLSAESRLPNRPFSIVPNS